jgi:molybdopterin/thiamine biosynthesis adenylyltransferase
MHTSIFEPLVIVGNNALTDIAIANGLGVGFEQVYIFGADCGRKYTDSFFRSLHPVADIYGGSITDLPKYDTTNCIDCTTLDSERGVVADAVCVTSTPSSVFVGGIRDVETDSIQVGGIGVALAVDSLRKRCVGEYEPALEQHVAIDAIVPKKILVVGGGGIGNYFALNSSMHDVTLVDFDVFEDHNAHRQMFCEPGTPKAKRLSSMFKHITPRNTRFDDVCIDALDSEQYVPDVVVGCVDNPQTRNILRSYSFDRAIPYFDGGVGTNQGQIFLNPGPFDETIVQQPKPGCAFVRDPSIVIPNCIIGMQLANVVGREDYKCVFDSMSKQKLVEGDVPLSRLKDVEVGF